MHGGRDRWYIDGHLKPKEYARGTKLQALRPIAIGTTGVRAALGSVS